MINLIPDEYRPTVDKYMQEAPVDVRGIAEEIGISVIEKIITGSGYLLLERGEYTIYVNTLEPHTRKNFTIAHELSHFFLHKHSLVEGTAFARGIEDDYGFSIERDADFLASEILMPYELMKRVVDREDIQDVQDLANAFGVSDIAMKIRLDMQDEYYQK